MLVLVTCALIMVLILVVVAAAASGRKARYKASSKYGGPETNLNIRALFDDPWKKR